MILGCDWIYDHTVGMNLKAREFTIEKDGNQICLQDETLPYKKFLVSHKKMHKLLNKGVVVYVQKLQLTEERQTFILALSGILSAIDDIFQEPTDLPPARDIDHKIPL
jgi:hypothetical protein